MGLSLEMCPVVYACCGRVPLRAACGVGAALGALAAGALLALHAGAGAAAARALCVPPGALELARHACFIFGVLLFAVHFLLLLATVFRSEALCQLYVWFVLAYLLVFTACALVFLSVAALSDADMVFVFAALATVLVFDCLALYFVIVVANFRMTLP